MGKMTDEMQRLRDKIDDAYNERDELISNLHHFRHRLTDDVNATLSNFRQTHQQTSQHLKNKRIDFIQTSSDKVHSRLNEYRTYLSQNVTSLRNTNQQDRMDMAHSMQEHLKGYMGALRTTVNNAQEAAQQQISDFRSDFAKKSQSEQDQRDDYMHTLQTSIGKLRQNLTQDRFQAAQIFAGLRGKRTTATTNPHTENAKAQAVKTPPAPPVTETTKAKATKKPVVPPVTKTTDKETSS